MCQGVRAVASPELRGWGGKVSEVQPRSSWLPANAAIEPPSSRNCKRRRREAAIAEGKKPLPTRGFGGAS